MSNEDGRYLYGIINADHKQEFGPIGVGGRGDVVYTLPYQDVAVVISRSPIIKYQVTRENTTTHAKVLEKAAETHIVLPVRFSTIAEDEEMIIDRVMKPRYQEFLDLFKKMEGKTELGLRARWKNVEAIFAEVAEEDKDIKALKKSLLKEKDRQKLHSGKVKIGELVQEAMAKKRKSEADELLQALKPFCLEYKELQFYGDMNLMNVAFLVDKKREHDFDQKIDELEEAHQERIQLKYTNSIIPYNFVEIVIRW